MPNLLGMWNPFLESFFSKPEFRIAGNHHLLEPYCRSRRTQVIQISLHAIRDRVCSWKRLGIDENEKVPDRAAIVRIQCTKNFSPDLGAGQQAAQHGDCNAETIALRAARRTQRA